jgi:hypothetical protein
VLARLVIGVLVPQIQVLLGTKDGFLKSQAHVHLQVGPSSRPAIASAATAATKEHVKEIVGVQFWPTAAIGKVKGTVLKVETAGSAAAKRIAATAALLKVGIDTSMSELIVEIALLLIRQYFVGFRCFFELVGRGIVVLWHSQRPRSVGKIESSAHFPAFKKLTWLVSGWCFLASLKYAFLMAALLAPRSTPSTS